MMKIKSCADCHSSFLAPTRGATLCPECRVKRQVTRERTPRHQFIAVDGEGEGNDYKLLGIGDQQYEWRNGLDNPHDVFQVLYDSFLDNRQAYFVGFYLSYDWNMWFKNMPRERIDWLFNPVQIARRSRHKTPHSAPFPVRYDGWEFDLLWGKRLKLRPEGGEQGWMYICDTGPFFQTSLLKALKTRPQPSLISDEDVALIEKGKAKRGTASLDDEMRYYNVLENRALSALLDEIDVSLRKIGTPLGRTQFHGPGQASQKWLKAQPGLQRSIDAINALSEAIYGPIAGSYYGGIFKTPCHGHIPGPVVELDINSAYPDVIAKLPCLCGEWRAGHGTPPVGAKLLLRHAEIVGADPRLGPLPYRSKERNILRPMHVSGWYWSFEIDASRRAGLIKSEQYGDWIAYMGCAHPPPLAAISLLYQERLKVGKETSMGKALKLIYNSAYGKLAQSIGKPQVSCAVYAGLITAVCRAKIIDAVATHPRGVDALLMIATDAVFFTSPHPTLPISHQLGEWEQTIREGLTIFKPGMYWDDHTRWMINQADENPVFKARGVRAKDFVKAIDQMDHLFHAWNPCGEQVWPGDCLCEPEQPCHCGHRIEINVEFAQVSIRQAWNRTRNPKVSAEVRDTLFHQYAGAVLTNFPVRQQSTPVNKQDATTLHKDKDGLWRTMEYDQGEQVESTPYDERFGRPDSEVSELVTEELPLDILLADALYSR